MALLLILFAIAGLLWTLVAARHLSIAVGCLLVILVGCVFGHPFFNKSIGPIPLTIDRVLWGLLIVQFLVFIKLGRTDLKPFNRTDAVIILLVVVLMGSTLLHDFRYKENLPLSRLLFFNLVPIGIYFVAKHCRLERQHLNVIYIALLLFGLYLGLTAIAEQRGLYGLVFPRYIVDPQYFEFLGRRRGPFLNPVSCGIYLTICFAATIFLWSQCWPIGKVFIVAVAAMIAAAAMLTLTRSVWLGLAIAAGLVIWIPAPRVARGALVICGTLVLCVLLIGFADKFNRFQRDKNVTAAEMAESVSLRPMLAHVAWKMFQDKPIAGHGFGQYTAAKKPYHYSETADMPLRKVLPYMQHNVFLSYLTETGLIGLTVLLSLLGSLAVKSWRLWNSPGLPLSQRQLGLLGLVMVSCYCVNGMFHDVSIISHVAAMLFLVMGLVENTTSQFTAHGVQHEPHDLDDWQIRQAA